MAFPITLSFARIELDKLGSLGVEACSRIDTYNQRLTLTQEQEYQSEDLFSRFEATRDNQKKAILLARMAEGQMSSLGYQEAEEYFIQALEVDPFSIYTLVTYGKLKADIFEYQASFDLINRAVSKVTKKTAFFVYYNLADVYGKTKEWGLKIKYLKEALKYDEYAASYLYTMAQHSLGVALGKMGQHSEAIKNFDEIINRELAKPYGPSRSLVIAARTKKISLERINSSLQKSFLDDLIKTCQQLNNAEQIVDELIHIRDEE